MQFSITEGVFYEILFWSTSNLLLKCGNTHLRREEEDRRFSQVQYVSLLHSEKFTRVAFKITMFSISYSDFGITWIIDSECIKLS